MTQKSWMTWVLLVGLVWVLPVGTKPDHAHLNRCFNKRDLNLLVADNFNGYIKDQNPWHSDICTVFLQRNNSSTYDVTAHWPKIERKDDSYLLYISKWHFKKGLYVLYGEQCNATVSTIADTNNCRFNYTVTDLCQIRCLDKRNLCKDADYDENSCSNSGPKTKDKYIINITAQSENCMNCDNPVKRPETEIVLNTTVPTTEGELDPTEAAKVMNGMADLASSINGSSVALSGGEGVTGILVRETESVGIEEVSFAYSSPNESLSIIEDKASLVQFSRSVTVSKEAFEKAQSMNVSVPFAAVFRFLNMAQEKNSTVLGNEVLAVEMGTTIKNLSDKININFWNMDFEGVPHCHSWDGEGSRPRWIDDGCQTVLNGSNITCQCSHLTFFAILLTPPNKTISSSDLSNLTTITQVGCGLSMFFLGIVLFMHFLLRRTKATDTTLLLIHLVFAMFLLNFTFLINNFVAKMKSAVGCTIMAALMHYFMLATFTWFGVQGFHLCLQLYTGGKIEIHHYILKVSITSWLIPSIIGIVLLGIGKYGEQVIYTDNTEDNVAMCWITDSDVHYIVNIGYYALVFIFTFSTFIIILSWLFCLRRIKTGNGQEKKNGISIVTVLGLCCLLGITWGFAFFAYGVLQIPSYYIFTVLNSFQGFFLFIYYYTTRHSKETNTGTNSSDNSSISTLKTGLDIFDNPYSNTPEKK
ncbi:adhesion G-protein coupled receptor G5-like [Trachinotus anak]|uniref:adhesion G-protein coupled receptor G5-like n=1 Tax=Trachinotus anak TaxID=443729 RepID=UPI0039F1AF48